MSNAKISLSSNTAGKAFICMVLLTVQFGFQPMLSHTFISKKVCKSSVILVQEVVKFFLAVSMLIISGNFSKAMKGWTIFSWVRVAAVPAALYSIQNTAALTAYQNLDGVTFNVLNQTKTLSAALCCYFLMGRKQSKNQILSLILLFISALIVENLIPINWLLKGEAVFEKEAKENSFQSKHVTHGVFPVLLASFISGLAGAISQMNLQTGGRNPYLFSSELCVASVVTISVSLLFSADGEKIRKNGFFHQWTLQTLIPVFTNAIGGIIVGLVTKYAGSVRKGFALIFGMVLTGVVQSIIEGVPLSSTKIFGGALAALSLFLYSSGSTSKKSRQKLD